MPSPDTSADVVHFLASPAAHGGAGPVEQHETHGARVFLAGEHALKIKRPVRFAYMDFSTLARRHAVLLRELELNRRFAPDLYLRLVAITRAGDGALAIGGDGEVVEWALEMRRFDVSRQLDALARRGPLDADVVKALADAVVESHRQAPARAEPGASARVERLVEQLASQLATETPPLAGRQVLAFGEMARAQLGRVRAILERRGVEGFVRRCHGDLHLGNIVLWRDRPTLFDALEFDEDLATIDTLYDLAFLLMDLDHAGQRAAANLVLNRYLWRHDQAPDLEALAALPLFLALRSGVRALVKAQHARQLGTGGNEEAHLAQGYLAAALGYLAPTAPRLVAVGGLSGTGKSTLAAMLAPDIGAAPGALHLRSDLERKAMLGVAETERLGAAHYTPEAGGLVYARLLEKAALALRAGHAVIVDAVFGEPEQRQAMAALAARTTATFTGLWLTAPRAALIARVAARRGDASDADRAVVEQQMARDVGAVDWPVVDASGGPERTLALARCILARAR